MHTAKKKTFICTIYIAGNPLDIECVCEKYAKENLLCVTVTLMNYIHPVGNEAGAAIGLIQYPKYPRETSEIESHAFVLMKLLLEECDQDSATIVTPETTTWFDRREEDPRLT